MTRTVGGRVLGLLGEVLVTLGVVLALFVVHQLWWTDIASGEKQRAAADALEQNWAGEPPADNPRGRPAHVERGVAFARLHIPALGSDYQFAVVRGTDDASLEIGPGHYEDTQDPGRPGNFAIAGHRVGRGAPFNDLDAVGSCAAIVVETRREWLIYRTLPTDGPTPPPDAAGCLPPEVAARMGSDPYAGLTGRVVVAPSTVSVIDPVPGHPGPPEPTMLPLITLTTCHPRYSAEQRLVLHGVLVRAETRSPGHVPVELRG